MERKLLSTKQCKTPKVESEIESKQASSEAMSEKLLEHVKECYYLGMEIRNEEE